MALGNRISEVLKQKDRSQAWLAEKLDLHVPHVNRLIKQQPNIQTALALRIANALGTTVEKLFYLT